MPATVIFDHQALLVRNLDVSAGFYSEILLLQEIENKTENPAIRWFSLGNGIQLHLISGDNSGVVPKKAIHFALSVSDFDGFLKHLDSRKIHVQRCRAGRTARIRFPEADHHRALVFLVRPVTRIRLRTGRPADSQFQQ
jgi:catechol 2,3-dioxygenase-like lactoylglutathione lyase family enzyme